MAPGVTYVIAGYAGPRNGMDERYRQDRFSYLRQHLDALCSLNHSLSEIIVVLNCDHPSDADGLVLPKYAGNTPVRLETRPNFGISYGAFAYGTLVSNPDNEFVILFEDDYIPCVDYFSDYLVDRFTSLPRCGMLCAATGPWPGSHTKIAGVFIGISRRKTLIESVTGSGGVIPHKDYARAWIAQVTWSQCLTRAGLTIEDWCDDYAATFWDSARCRVNWYHGESFDGGARSGLRSDDLEQDTSVRALIAPLQAVNRVVPVWIGPRMVMAAIDERGYLHAAGEQPALDVPKPALVTEATAPLP